jgi:hypothetical protein
MKQFRRRHAQSGAALLIMVTVLVMGFAWFAVGYLRKAPVEKIEREVITGQALQAAKQALLGYIAQYAARSDTAEPGQLPCPESVTLANPGEASTSCSNATATLGRLPWKTLGIDQLVDGDGEALWYAISPGFRSAPINFGTPANLAFGGSTVVAVIMAPGRALNTTADPATPPAGCAKVDQFAAASRYSAPLAAARFFECGNAAGSYVNLGTSQWTNDRALAITADEWANAIAGPVADRLQRQVAPAMESYRSTTSPTTWGQGFLPTASAFTNAATNPVNNDLCGDNNVHEGMPPTATVASGACATDWASGSASNLGSLLLGSLLVFGGCNPEPAYMRCDFSVLLAGLLPPRIQVNAPRIGYTFRSFDPSQITVEVNSNGPQPATTYNFSRSVSAADGSGTIRFDVSLPLLSIADVLHVRIPHPTDALLADARSAWYVNNGWDRYTYYAVSQAATHNPAGNLCNSVNLTGCLTVANAPSPANNKRLVLSLMGPRAVGAASWPGSSPDAYLEAQNGTPGDRQYEIETVTASFNDRLAMCPFSRQNHAGTTVTSCN